MRLFRYLRLSEFVHHNTDGPANPNALVYERRRIERDFRRSVSRALQALHVCPAIAGSRPAREAFMGWHLWVCLRPVADLDPSAVSKTGDVADVNR